MNIRFAIVLTLLALSGCTDYVEIDKSGEKIDCEQLLASAHKNKKHIYDTEQDGGHKFSQCRSEIEKDHEDRCDNYVKGFFEVNAWYGGRDGEEREKHNDKMCILQAKEYISLLPNEYRFKGNALIVNGVAFNKSTLTIYAVKKQVSVGVVYFKVSISNGKDTASLRYLNLHDATAVQKSLVDFISN